MSSSGRQPDQLGVTLLGLTAHWVEIRQWDVSTEGILDETAAKDKIEKTGLGTF